MARPHDVAARNARPAPKWVRETRPPVPLPPPRSCDCQFHIFGDPAKYPLRYDVTYKQPQASFADMRKVLRAMGFERGVIVLMEPPLNSAGNRAHPFYSRVSSARAAFRVAAAG